VVALPCVLVFWFGAVIVVALVAAAWADADSRCCWHGNGDEGRPWWWRAIIAVVYAAKRGVGGLSRVLARDF